MQHREKYTLTWHSCTDHLKNALKEMMTSSEFADVTLVTDDKQQIRAHRNILSACSPVFKNILQIDCNSTNPVIYLRGIQHSEMESIMQFIYLGEAKFYEERMSELLMVSKNLEIKDLSNGIEMNDQTALNAECESNVHDNNVSEEKVVYESPSRVMNGDVEYQTQTSTIGSTPIIINKKARETEVVSEKGKIKCQDCERVFISPQALWYHTKSKHEGVKYPCNQCGQQFAYQHHLTTHIQSKHEGVNYACNQCDYLAGRQDNLTTHIQSKHEGVKYACNQCDQQFTKQCNLTTHIQSKHEGVKYACNQCDYQATTQGNLTTHIQSKHEGVKYSCN